MPPAILDSLRTRTEPLRPEELGRLVVELAHVTRRNRDRYLRELEKRPDLIRRDLVGDLRSRVRLFMERSAGRNVDEFEGYIGVNGEGMPVSPDAFRFQGIATADGVTIYVGDRFAELTKVIIADADFRRYFAGTHSALTRMLAVARVVIDHTFDDLPDPDPTVHTLKSEDERTLFAWELLARIDSELNGADPKTALGSDVFFDRYLALKSFVEMAGLKPMAVRALAIRDGREVAFGFAAGQGSKYLVELKSLVETEPSARALYNELKPLYARYGIDLDRLLELAGADESQIENYLAVNGVATSMPVSALLQLLRLRVLENHGYNPYRFAGVSGQSGGLPFAYFMAGAFEAEGYQPPVIPHGLGGYHSMQAVKNFAGFMLEEGKLQQSGTEPHYASGVTRMEPLVRPGSALPTAGEIDAYFARYRVVNMAISGIPWSAENPSGSQLGKMMDAINARFPDRGSSYVFMSNLNTGPTPAGRHSWFILVGGRGRALAELAKMIVLKKADGYSEEIQKLVASLAENPDVGNPITNTRVTLAPHDPTVLTTSYARHLRWAVKHGVRLSAPRVPVVPNWPGFEVHNGVTDADARVRLDGLLQQQYTAPVNMPLVVRLALQSGSTVLFDIGPGSYLVGTALPANAGDSAVDIVGVTARDAEEVAGLERLTTTDPRKAYPERARPNAVVYETALDKLQKVEGLTVREEQSTGQDGADSKHITIRLDRALSADNFSAVRDWVLALDAESHIIGLLRAEGLPVSQLLRNSPNFEYHLHFVSGALVLLSIHERGREMVRINVENGHVLVGEGGDGRFVWRVYRKTQDGFAETGKDSFRAEASKAYAYDWGLNVPESLRVGDVVTDTQVASSEKLTAFAKAVQSREARYVDPRSPDFQAHPHFLVELAWKAMLTPAFSAELDLDFTRVVDEGKFIEAGVPVRAGDVITTEAVVSRVEDFRQKTGYEGRRVIVYAVARNRNGDIVGRVVSTLVSRIPTGLSAGETKVVYENRTYPVSIDLLEGKKIHKNDPEQVVARGFLEIPPTLADTYAHVDQNRIHLSDLSAALAGIPGGRVMQGLGTLAYVNEQVVLQLRRDHGMRAFRGISNLRFSGFVRPGDSLSYEVARLQHAEGDHQFRITVKKAGTENVVLTYDLVLCGPKTAVVFTGQGSQYRGMGNDLVRDKFRRALLEGLQAQVAKGPDGHPLIDLLSAMNSASQDTSQAQPMIMAYSYVLFLQLKEQGLIPADAVYSGHSLGMWIALLASGAVRDPATAMESVRRRGSAMEKYNDSANPQGMIAVIPNAGTPPLDKAKIEILERFINHKGDGARGILPRILALANDNSPNQVVLGGHVSALVEATPILEAWGYRVVRLPVANAFHTPLMTPAANDFWAWMKEHGNPFQVPEGVTLYMDVAGRPLAEIAKKDDKALVLADIMRRQIATGVQWRATIRRMLADGVRRFVEVGPSRNSSGQLAGLIAQEAKALGVEGTIEIIFANPMLAEPQMQVLGFDAKQGVGEFDRPRVVFPSAPPKREKEAGDKSVIVVAGVGPVSAEPAMPMPSVPVVLPAQMQAVSAGFLAEHRKAIESPGANLDALAGQLADQIARLGPGARGALTARLAELGGAGGASQAAGPSVEDVMAGVIVKFKPGRKDAVKPAAKLKDDLGIGSSELADFYQELKKELKVDPPPARLEELGDNPTIQAVAKVFRDAGAGGGTAVSSVPAQVVERKAIELALARIPAMAMPAPAVASVAVPPVSPASVSHAREEVLDQFLNKEKGSFAQGVPDALVARLAVRYEALGPGAIAPLQARLAALQPAQQAAATAGPSVEDVMAGVIAIFRPGKIDAAKRPEAKLKDDLGIGSSELADFYQELKNKLRVEPKASDIEALGDNPTLQAVADVFRTAGAKGGGAVSSALALQPADELDRRAIEMVLPRLVALTPQAGATVVTAPDPAQAEKIRELEARIAALEAVVRGRGTAEGAGEDVPVRLTKGGEVQTEAEIELAQLRKALENVRSGTSDFFVDRLMQPHFDPSKAYTFAEVSRNGGRNNLMHFYADLRMGRLTTVEYDRMARVNRLANQLDEISLGWLEGFIKSERSAGRTANVEVLEILHRRAEARIASGAILTGNVITITAGDHVPEYGSPHRTRFVPRTDGTIIAAGALTSEGLSDPKSAEDMQHLLETGADLRGVRVLVHEAGTLSGPLVAKLLQLGADVVVTNYASRDRMRPDGQSQNDFFWRLYNDNAAVGARLTVLPNMQPGNPHDETALLEWFSGPAEKFARFESLGTDPAETFREQKALVEMLPHDAFGMDLRQRLAKVEGERKAGSADKVLVLSDAEKKEAVRRLLPQVYMNGAVKVEYGPPLKGDAHSTLAVMVLSSRRIAIELAALHQKFKTGSRLLFDNVTSPNDGENVAEEEGRLVPSAIPFSGFYDLAKQALGPGNTAAVAKAAGIVGEDGKPILREMSRKTGWLQSDGSGGPTAMSGNDFIAMRVASMAGSAGKRVKISTGDEGASRHVSGIVAMLRGNRRGAEHLDYDDTGGLSAVARSGELGKILAGATRVELEKHREAKTEWERAHSARPDPSRIPNDGSIIDLNRLNIAVRGVAKGHPHAMRPDDIVFGDDVPVVTGYGMVGPLGPDALSNYRGMLARGHFRGHKGAEWLGEYDFYNLARSMGVDVSGWDPQKMAESVGLKPEDAGIHGGDWAKTFEAWLLKNSGLQRVSEFVEFEVVRDVTFPEDTKIPVTDPAMMQKMSLAGYQLFRKPDGLVYALVRAGQTYKLPVKYRLPVTFAGALPGTGYHGFDFERFGMGGRRDSVAGANAARMAKMITAQILMAMGGYSPAELQREFGPENMFVAISTGLGDLEPFNRMTVEPVLGSDRVANYLMAALLPDAVAGQVATEQLGAEGMALAVIAACSTGNANIVMAVKELFSRYYMAAREGGNVNWQEVFRKLWIAGGVDYAATFNAIFGFVGVGALITDDWISARSIEHKSASRPDDVERAGFVVGVGGGAVSLEPLGHAKGRGRPVYGMVLGGAFRTDGDKVTTAGAREGYGRGQQGALFEAWDQAREYLTERRYSENEVFSEMARLLGLAEGTRTVDINGRLYGLEKPTLRNTFVRGLNLRFGLNLTWKDVTTADGCRALAVRICEQTRTLRKNVKFVVVAHKTSTMAGDPFEEESLRAFLSKILSPGEFAHLMTSKAHIGHLLGGSSGADSALTPLLLAHRALPGNPGLDNVSASAGANAWVLHHRDALDLGELYGDDAKVVVIREAAGFNAKNTAVFEARGKVPFDTMEEAETYSKGLVESYARERTQKRAERTGVRTMAFNLDSYQHVPIEEYEDLYALYLRSHAVACALVSGRKFDFDHIENWIYEFPVNDGVHIAVDPKAPEAVQLHQHNAAKYAEARDMVHGILADFNQDELRRIGEEARTRGWDKQAVVFYGASDGMGLRTLLALIASGAVKEVVGVHFDLPVTNPKNRAVKTSAYTPEIVKAYAASKGVRVVMLNENGILYAMRDSAEKGVRAGDPLPLQESIVRAVEAARARQETKDVLFWDFVAFGAPWRRAGASEMHVPTIDAYGRLALAKVATAQNAAQGQVMTLNPMGHNHDRLLRVFGERGWLGQRSVTFAADWWGSESEDMLHGVYGGALLGDAKLAQKRLLREFASARPESGKHGYLGYPAFMSFALHQIPGGTLIGLLGKRVYEDIQRGVRVEGIDPADRERLRFYSMEELALMALGKSVSGEFIGRDGNKVAVDEHEMAIAGEIDRRFKIVAQHVGDAVSAKAASTGDPDAKLDPEESLAILKDFVPADYLDYCYAQIPNMEERRTSLRRLAQDRNGIEPLQLPERLQTRYPFFARAYGPSVNTAGLAISVIDAGGVGTLSAFGLGAEELDRRISAVKHEVGEDAPLIVNVMMSDPKSLRDAQLEILLHNKPSAVSFGNGFVTEDIVKRLHSAGILVIQLTGTVAGAKSLAEKGVDLVIAERNFGPGHIAEGRGSDPETLVKALRQELYDARIPVIAGGGLVDPADVANARHWGASAIQLDDPIAYSEESPYAAKALVPAVDRINPVATLVDEDGKPLHVLNTEGARRVQRELEDLRSRVSDAAIRKPLEARIFARAFEAGSGENLERGLFLAGTHIGRVKVGAALEEVFEYLGAGLDAEKVQERFEHMRSILVARGYRPVAETSYRNPVFAYHDRRYVFREAGNGEAFFGYNEEGRREVVVDLLEHTAGEPAPAVSAPAPHPVSARPAPAPVVAGTAAAGPAEEPGPVIVPAGGEGGGGKGSGSGPTASHRGTIVLGGTDLLHSQRVLQPSDVIRQGVLVFGGGLQPAVVRAQAPDGVRRRQQPVPKRTAVRTKPVSPWVLKPATMVRPMSPMFRSVLPVLR